MPRTTACEEIDRLFSDMQGAVRAGRWVSARASLAPVADDLQRVQIAAGIAKKALSFVGEDDRDTERIVWLRFSTEM